MGLLISRCEWCTVNLGTTSFPFASNRARSYLKVIKKGSLQTIKQWYVVIFHWNSLNWTTVVPVPLMSHFDSFCVYTPCIFRNLELTSIKYFLLLRYWSCLVAILQRVLGHFLPAPGRHSDFQASCTITAHEGGWRSHGPKGRNMSVYTIGINAALLLQYPTLNAWWFKDVVNICKYHLCIYTYICLYTQYSHSY